MDEPRNIVLVYKYMSRKIVKSCDLDIDCWSKNHSFFLKMYMYIIYKIRHWVAVIYECVFIDFIRILRLLSRVFMMNFPAFLSRIFGFLGQFYMLGTFFQVYKLQFFEKSSISWKEFPPPLPRDMSRQLVSCVSDCFCLGKNLWL